MGQYISIQRHYPRDILNCVGEVTGKHYWERLSTNEISEKQKSLEIIGNNILCSVTNYWMCIVAVNGIPGGMALESGWHQLFTTVFPIDRTLTMRELYGRRYPVLDHWYPVLYFAVSGVAPNDRRILFCWITYSQAAPQWRISSNKNVFPWILYPVYT